MNYKIVLAAATGLLFASSCNEDTTNKTPGSDTVSSNGGLPVGDNETSSSSGNMVLSETDSYIDLSTGKSIRIHRDPATNEYTQADMKPLNLYVNTSSRDTFWGSAGRRVNGALIRSDAGVYTVDELRIERNGDGYKARSADGELKIKENENELKIKDGDAKIKSNDNEYKYKDDDIKIKSNENETKIKTKDSKTEIDHRTGEVKTKAR